MVEVIGHGHTGRCGRPVGSVVLRRAWARVVFGAHDAEGRHLHTLAAVTGAQLMKEGEGSSFIRGGEAALEDG